MNKITEKLNRIFKIWKNYGTKGGANRLRHFNYKLRESRNYQKWIKREKIDDKRRAEMLSQIEKLSRKPLISVVMPVYNIEEKWLRICIESVTNQLYENWEFCIADDKSPSLHIRKVLEEYAAKDARIKVVFRPENGHISAASNSALELASGEFCVLLDHDDELSEDALFYVAKELNDFPETEMIFSDEDMIDENGRRYEPKFKPDFSRDLLYSLNLITHLSAYKTTVLRQIGGFRLGAEGSQDYDLALRVIEQISEKNIRHIPRILYHWRAIQGSVALSSDEKPYAHERAREALRRHFEVTGKNVKVEPSFYNLHRVSYNLPKILPSITVIFYSAQTTEEQEFHQLFLPNVETIFVSEADAEKLNSAVSQSNGEILVFVDNNLKPLSENWLKEIVGFAIQPEIGAVGAKILSFDETILDGGLIINTDALISIAHQGFPNNNGGNIGRNQFTGNFSAVSIGCLCVRKNLFEEIGGFDANNLPNRFFDADFCLKLREKDYRIVYAPHSELIKIDNEKRLISEKKPTDSEIKYFTERWLKKMDCDPFYNPNLSKKDGSFSIKL